MLKLKFNTFIKMEEKILYQRENEHRIESYNGLLREVLEIQIMLERALKVPKRTETFSGLSQKVLVINCMLTFIVLCITLGEFKKKLKNFVV